MQSVQFMHRDGHCEDFLEFTESLGFDASAAQSDEDGMDCIDNALEWLNRAHDGVRYILAEFGVVVAVPA
ncbi:MAG TPA: hypothetical protein PLN36_01455 [Bacteroidales bacterium]|nr:hypothetical protein [Bacteroidales bacterium]HRU33956.1 hypothetical protein [Bacteroidales bacterium]